MILYCLFGMDYIKNSLRFGLKESESHEFSVDSTEFWYFPFTPTVKIVVAEFLLSSLLQTYGIYLAEFVSSDILPYQTLIWTPITFVSVWLIMNPLSIFIYKRSRYKISLFICLLSGILLTSCTFLTNFYFPRPQLQILNFGIIGGISSNLILTRIKIKCETEFRSRVKSIEIVSQISKRLSLLIFPHLIMLLMLWTGLYKTQIIQSSIILHIIPILIMKSDDVNNSDDLPPTLSRYRTIPGLINSQEMIDLAPVFPTIQSESVNEDSSSSISSNSSESSNENDEDETKQDSIQILEFKTPTGVIHVLPQIPEESETDEDEEKLKSIKRLSKMSENLNDIITKDDQKQSNAFTLSVKEFDRFPKDINSVYLRPSESREIINNESFWIERFNCFSSVKFSPYQKYKCKRRKKIITNFLNKVIPKNFKIFCSLKEFYICLITKSILTFGTVIFISTIPHLLVTNKHLQNSTFILADCPTILSAISAAGIFSLFFIPRITELSHTKKLGAFVISLLVMIISLLPADIGLPNNAIVIGSLFFSFANSVIVYYEEEIYVELMGRVSCPECKEILDGFSGLIILLIYALVNKLNVTVYRLFSIVCYLYFSILILWSGIFLSRFTY